MDHLLLIGAKTAVLLLGTAIACLSVLAYARTRERVMLYLGVGFALIALGSFLEGLLFEVLNWDLLTVHIVESAFVLAGLATLAIALRPRGTLR
jgi:hypothetical protein